MTADVPKVDFDRQLLDIYLTGLQSEVEAKLRRVVRFREQVQNIGESGRLTDRTAMQRALAALLEQVDTMLDTNVLVRQTLEDVRLTALQLLKDLEEF